MVKNRKLLNEELGRKSIDEFKTSEKLPVAIILDNVRSLNNVGSVFRTSDAFLVEKIFLCGITGTPPHPEIHRSALGAEKSVEWEYVESTIRAVEGLKQSGYLIISAEQVEQSVLLNQFYPEKGWKYALVFGNEVKGVGQDVVDISDVCIEIPQLGTKHSFNISVSVGIVLWDFFVKVMAPF
ncbi:MAG TPA: TrmH family RNA methyltransferase [Bacteroidales bacterium]|nr:TrmH family RNA methyltransferase [Bacteroidales bacterium]